MLAAVQQDGLALRFAAEHLRADRVVVLAAVEDRSCRKIYMNYEMKEGSVQTQLRGAEM